MRARLIPLTLTLLAAFSQSSAQEVLEVPEDQQILEALETPDAPAMPETSPTPDAAIVPEATEAAVNPNPLSGLALESLSATLSAPLFTPSRTGPIVEAPVEAVVEAPPPPPEVAPEQPPPSLQLVGIVMTDAEKTALLKDAGTNEIHRLNTGDDYEGWSLTIVDGRSVEFRSGDRVEALKMFESFPTPASYGVPGMPGLPFDPTMPQPGEPPLPDPNIMQPPLPEDPAAMQPPPQIEGMPEGITPEGLPADANPQPAPPPENFDPQTGELLIPEEGPLDADGNPRAQQQP